MAVQAVKAEQSDPSSVQVRNVKSTGSLVCGEYNAKNQMGGYVGFRRFIFSANGMTWPDRMGIEASFIRENPSSSRHPMGGDAMTSDVAGAQCDHEAEWKPCEAAIAGADDGRQAACREAGY